MLDGGNVILDGYDASRLLRMTWDDVVFDRPDAIKVKSVVRRDHAKGRDRRISRSLARTFSSLERRATPQARLREEVRAIPRQRCRAAGWRWRVRGDRRRAIHRHRRRHRRRRADLSHRRERLDRTSGQRLGRGPSSSFETAAIARSSPSTGRASRSLGEIRDGAVLTFDAASDTPTPTGGTYGTRGSFTLRVVAPDFRAENMTIENAFDYPANAAKPDSDRTKFKNPQAVALMTDLGSDRATFVNVKIRDIRTRSFPTRAAATSTRVKSGATSISFSGRGRSVFDDCDIVSRDRGSATNNGYVTAPSTKGDQPFGFLFVGVA